MTYYCIKNKNLRMDNSLNQNFLNQLESISSAASLCGLNFQKLGDVNNDISQVSGFLGITADQTVFFSCLTELSFQKTVTLDILAKHLKCSTLKLITFMHEVEALEKKGYIQKVFRRRVRNYSYNDLGFKVPYYVIEALRKGDASLLEAATKFDLPGFLKQVSDTVEERNVNSLTTGQLISEIEFLISCNPELPFVSFIDRSLSQTLSKCTVFAISYVRLKGQYNVCIDNFADAMFDDLGQQLDFAQQVAAGTHELIQKKLLKNVTSEFDGDKSV